MIKLHLIYSQIHKTTHILKIRSIVKGTSELWSRKYHVHSISVSDFNLLNFLKQSSKFRLEKQMITQQPPDCNAHLKSRDSTGAISAREKSACHI